MPTQNQRDITDVYHRLRLARSQNNEDEVKVLTNRLDWLLDKESQPIPHQSLSSPE